MPDRLTCRQTALRTMGSQPRPRLPRSRSCNSGTGFRVSKALACRPPPPPSPPPRIPCRAPPGRQTHIRARHCTTSLPMRDTPTTMLRPVADLRLCTRATTTRTRQPSLMGWIAAGARGMLTWYVSRAPHSEGKSNFDALLAVAVVSGRARCARAGSRSSSPMRLLPQYGARAPAPSYAHPHMDAAHAGRGGAEADWATSAAVDSRGWAARAPTHLHGPHGAPMASSALWPGYYGAPPAHAHSHTAGAGYMPAGAGGPGRHDLRAMAEPPAAYTSFAGAMANPAAAAARSGRTQQPARPQPVRAAAAAAPQLLPSAGRASLHPPRAPAMPSSRAAGSGVLPGRYKPPSAVAQPVSPGSADEEEAGDADSRRSRRCVARRCNAVGSTGPRCVLTLRWPRLQSRRQPPVGSDQSPEEKGTAGAPLRPALSDNSRRHLRRHRRMWRR